MELFKRLRHPRLAQAEQHMGHAYHSQGNRRKALEFYLQSARNFELAGTANFDTEYACTLSAISNILSEMGEGEQGLAWLRYAVISCEAITGQDHVEAEYYRNLLEQSLAFSGL